MIGVRAGVPGLGSKPSCGELRAVGAVDEGPAEGTPAADEGAGVDGSGRLTEAAGDGVGEPQPAMTVATNRIEPSRRTSLAPLRLVSHGKVAIELSPDPEDRSGRCQPLLCSLQLYEAIMAQPKSRVPIEPKSMAPVAGRSFPR